MAEPRPHYSTLLDKEEILLDELSENDVLYILRSEGGAKRDRRISLKTLKEWILKDA